MKNIWFLITNLFMGVIITCCLLSMVTTLKISNPYEIKDSYATFFISLDSIVEYVDEESLSKQISEFIEENPKCFIALYQSEKRMTRIYECEKQEMIDDFVSQNEWNGEYTISGVTEEKIKAFIKIFPKGVVFHYLYYEKENRVVDSIKMLLAEKEVYLTLMGIIIVALCYIDIIRHAIKNDEKRIGVFWLVGAKKRDLIRQNLKQTLIIISLCSFVGSLIAAAFFSYIQYDPSFFVISTAGAVLNIFISEIVVQILALIPFQKIEKRGIRN